MDSLNVSQRDLLEQYFSSLTTHSIPSAPSPLLAQVRKIEGEKIAATYQHFQDVKALLRPEQLEGFEEFLGRILREILTVPSRPPHPLRKQ